jgi:hypothetical protein
MYNCFASFADKDATDFATQIRSTVTEEALRNVAVYVLKQTTAALRRLRDAVNSHNERLSLGTEEAETALSDLRDARDELDEFNIRRENLFRQTAELYRQHFPESQFGAKALEFAYSVSIPTDSQEKAELHSKEAQEHLHEESVAVANKLFADFLDANELLLNDLCESCKAMMSMIPERRTFRPPEFIPIKYFSHLDLYEQARGASVGQNLTKSIRPRWTLHRLIKRFERIANVDFEQLTAVAGYESLARRNRASLRREQATFAAEHFRRIYWAGMAQIESYHAQVKLDLVARSRMHFASRNRAISNRLRDLARERRKTNAYAVSAERLLLQADSAARRVLSLTSHFTDVHSDSSWEGKSNGLSASA